MKKSHILLAVLFMAALVSCQENELRNDEFVAKDGDIVFRMTGNGRATKSMDSVTPMKGVTIDLGSQAGTHFFLEETVINLNEIDFGPQTKGTPAYTLNLGQLYADNLGVSAVGGTFGDFAYASAEEEIGSDNKWLYWHHYATDPWPEDEEEEVGFYLRMPASPAGVTFGTGAYGTNDDGATITFTYKTPNTAAATQDILFGYRSLAKKDYPKTGIPAVLYHALTGVKFAIGNDDDGIVITEVSFEGLYDSGKCVIAPPDLETAGTEDYNVAVWSNLTSTDDYIISSEGLLNDDGEQQIADYGKSKNYDFPTSFTGHGAANNMNDDDASKTFWLIPQAFEGRNDVMLTIKYNYCDNTDLETKLTLGEIFGERGIEWGAGELHTYIIKVDEVNLQIQDEIVEETRPIPVLVNDEYVNQNQKTLVKKNVEIYNTSNVEVFIRAAIVGQWVTANGDPIFGFTDEINNLYVVESWYEDQFVNKSRHHGYFVELADYNEDNGYNNWYLGDDGYYYYSESVETDEKTLPLFDSYVLGTRPNAEIAGVVVDYNDMYFVLEVSTQAISARTSNGTLLEDYEEAWEAASRGEKPIVTTTTTGNTD